MSVSPSGVNVGQFAQAGLAGGLVSPGSITRPRGMLEQLGLAGPQPECDSDASTEDYDEPTGAPFPQVGNIHDVSGAPELGPTGVKWFKDKVDALAQRLPLPVVQRSAGMTSLAVIATRPSRMTVGLILSPLTLVAGLWLQRLIPVLRYRQPCKVVWQEKGQDGSFRWTKSVR